MSLSRQVGGAGSCRQRLCAPLLLEVPSPWVPPAHTSGAALALQGLLLGGVRVEGELPTEAEAPGGVQPITAAQGGGEQAACREGSVRKGTRSTPTAHREGAGAQPVRPQGPLRPSPPGGPHSPSSWLMPKLRSPLRSRERSLGTGPPPDPRPAPVPPEASPPPALPPGSRPSCRGQPPQDRAWLGSCWTRPKAWAQTGGGAERRGGTLGAGAPGLLHSLFHRLSGSAPCAPHPSPLPGPHCCLWTCGCARAGSFQG